MSYPLTALLRNFLHRQVIGLVRLYYIHVWGMQIGEGTRISLKAKLDRTNPKGVSIGAHSYVTFGAVVLTHDFVHRRHLPTRIGSYCFVGCNSTILPGVTIGDHCIVAANTLVREDVPSHCIVAGNPGRIVRRGIETIRYGWIPFPDEARVGTPPPPDA